MYKPLRRSGIHSSAKVCPTVMVRTPGITLRASTPCFIRSISSSVASSFTFNNTTWSITVCPGILLYSFSGGVPLYNDEAVAEAVQDLSLELRVDSYDC